MTIHCSFIFNQVCVPDSYRGKYRKPYYQEDDLATLYADEIDVILSGLHMRGKKVCGFMAESIQGCGGQVVLPKGYLKRVYK